MAVKHPPKTRLGRPPKSARLDSLMQHGADRSEIVTVRFTPRQRYLLELAARSQHRTVSGVVSWAVDETLGQVELHRRPDPPVSLDVVAETLWHPDEGTRLDILGDLFPYLLTRDEHLHWLTRQRDTNHDGTTTHVCPGE